LDREIKLSKDGVRLTKHKLARLARFARARRRTKREERLGRDRTAIEIDIETQSQGQRVLGFMSRQGEHLREHPFRKWSEHKEFLSEISIFDEQIKYARSFMQTTH
jgi:hypothetical protein